MAEFEGPLLVYARRLLGDADLARDCVQDTFTRLWQADRNQVEAHLRAWLYTVCRNRAHDHLRKESRMTALTDASLDGFTARHQPGQSPAREEKSDLVPDGELARLVSALPGRQQEAVRLRFQSGLSYREIAEVMQTTVNNVGVLLHSAILSLRRQIESPLPALVADSHHR